MRSNSGDPRFMADSAPDDDRAPAAREPAPRRRGLVGSGYILGPVVLLWGLGLGVSWVVGQRHRPEMVPFTVGLYGCAAFFIHAYWLAWRAGAFLRRYGALVMAILILVALAALHADDADARLVWSVEGPRDRPALPGLFVAAAADLVGATLLLLHGVILGLGSRAARVIETALGIDDEEEQAPPRTDDEPSEADAPAARTSSAPSGSGDVPRATRAAAAGDGVLDTASRGDGVLDTASRGDGVLDTASRGDGDDASNGDGDASSPAADDDPGGDLPSRAEG